MNKHDRPLATLDHNPLIGYFMIEDGAADITPKNEADAREMRKLFALQHAGVIRLMVTRSTAMEKQPLGKTLDEQALLTRLTKMGLDPEDIFTHPRPMPFATPGESNTVSFGVQFESRLRRALWEILFQGRTEPDARNAERHWPTYRDRECARRGDLSDIEKQAIADLDNIRYNGNLPPSQRVVSLQTPALDTLGRERRQQLEVILAKMFDTWNNKICDAEGLWVHASHAVYAAFPEHAVFVTSDKDFKRFSPVLRKTNWERLKDLGFPGHIMTPKEAADYFQKLTSVELPDTD